MTVRKQFERAADAVVQFYSSLNQPQSDFIGMLAERGYFELEPRISLTEKAIRGMFSGLATGVEAIAEINRPGYSFLDLLEDRGYMAVKPANLVELRVANDNRASVSGDDHTDRKAA